MALARSLLSILPESLRLSAAVSFMRLALRILDHAQKMAPAGHVQFAIDLAQEKTRGANYMAISSINARASISGKSDKFARIEKNENIVDLNDERSDGDFGFFKGLIFALPISIIIWICIFAVIKIIL